MIHGVNPAAIQLPRTISVDLSHLIAALPANPPEGSVDESERAGDGG